MGLYCSFRYCPGTRSFFGPAVISFYFTRYQQTLFLHKLTCEIQRIESLLAYKQIKHTTHSKFIFTQGVMVLKGDTYDHIGNVGGFFLGIFGFSTM